VRLGAAGTIGRLSSAQERAVRLPGLNLTLTVKHRVNWELRQNTETARGVAERPRSMAGNGAGPLAGRSRGLSNCRKMWRKGREVRA